MTITPSDQLYSIAELICVPFLFYITSKLLLKMSRNYNAIEVKQIEVTVHALEAFGLSLLFPFYSYFIIRLNFQDTQDIDEIISNLQGAVRCGSVIILLCTFELTSRFDTLRPLVVFHHVLLFSDWLLSVIFHTSIMMNTACIVLYFNCFKAPTFMGLFMYRIYPDSKITPNVILFGMLVFGITRPFQIIWIGAAAFGSWNDENVVKWQGVMQVIVGLVLTGIQLLTLKIHYGVWMRCIAKGKGKSRKEEEIVGQDDMNECSEDTAGISDLEMNSSIITSRTRFSLKH